MVELQDDILRGVIAAGLDDPQARGRNQSSFSDEDDGDGGRARRPRLAPGQISFCFSRRTTSFDPENKDKG
jgi:hypothetical protein